MKTKVILPPLVALAIGGAWLGTQRQSISALERESEVLRKAIAARSTGTATDSPQGRPASSAKAAKEKEKLDWKKIAAQFSEQRQNGGMGDMRTMMNFHQRLQAMSKEELVTALEEIAALDCPVETRNMLEQMILGPLVEKDPELALTRFIGRLQDHEGSLSWQLSTVLQQWAEKDPTAAIGWFDRQIAAGTFDSKSLDGKSRSRLQFEGNLIHFLLGSDPDAAGRRLGALPEDQRNEALSQFSMQQLKEDDQLAFASLVRDQVPEKDQARALSQQATRLLGNDGYAKVTEFLDRIQATPAERTACVERAAESKIQTIARQKKVTREDLDTMREWVTAQAPEKTGAVTGKALANASRYGNKMEYSEAAELAVQYHETSGNDDVLSSFLEAPARQNKEQARLLAAKISDGARREEILKNLK